MHKKSQASLEFISTYAWAFVAIAATIGILYYFGVFDFGKYLPQNCIFPLQFKCLDFSLQPSTVRVKLVNDIGEDVCVNNDEIVITNDVVTPLSCDFSNIPPSPDCTDDPTNEWKWEHATTKDLEFTDCKDGAYIPGGRAELRIQMKYYAINTPSHTKHDINGKINGKVIS